MDINISLLILMMMATLWTVMCRSLLKATIGLAVTSAVLTAIMFRLDSPLVAVFELSVCTGLITVVFVSTISLTKPLTHKEIVELSKARHKRFVYLPFLIILAGAFIYLLKIPNDFSDTTMLAMKSPEAFVTAPVALWNFRELDLFAQIMLIIAGALGVAILFEEKKVDEW